MREPESPDGATGADVDPESAETAGDAAFCAGKCGGQWPKAGEASSNVIANATVPFMPSLSLMTNQKIDRESQRNFDNVPYRFRIEEAWHER
jgi:hypothetical protein